MAENNGLGANIDVKVDLPPSVRAPKTAKGLPETVTIILEEGENVPPTGLPVSHNGTAYIIKPGIEVTIPVFLLEILDHAVMSSPVVDPNSQQVIGYRDRLRYPYRIARPAASG